MEDKQTYYQTVPNRRKNTYKPIYFVKMPKISHSIERKEYQLIGLMNPLQKKWCPIRALRLLLRLVVQLLNRHRPQLST